MSSSIHAMKKGTAILFGLLCLLLLWTNGATHSGATTKAFAGNIPDGTYTIFGESSHRCVEVPNSSCRDRVGLQIFDCDPAGAANNQKFNVMADGSGAYTISAANSDLCLEVYDPQDGNRILVQQNVCSPGKVTQKWAMSQYGVNLEIRGVVNNQCMDIMSRATANYSVVNLHPCKNGTNQRWRLNKTTFNENGVVCRASPSHPERDCSGLNEKQTKVYLGKTLTKGRCEDVCKASNLSGCSWGDSVAR
jgi:hypothetical protein